MEVRIRYMEPETVKKIDRLAKEQGMKRQEFLHTRLNQLAVFDEENEREKRLEDIVQKNIQTMEHCYTAINEMNDLMQFENPGDDT